MSPVTVVDFAVQAVLIWTIHHVFSLDSFVAEEYSELFHKNTHLDEQTRLLIQFFKDEADDNPCNLQLPASCAEVLSALDPQNASRKPHARSRGREWRSENPRRCPNVLVSSIED